MMRLIAIAKGKGEIDKVVELLREYVEIHQTDQNAWLELANVYVGAGECVPFHISASLVGSDTNSPRFVTRN